MKSPVGLVLLASVSLISAYCVSIDLYFLPFLAAVLITGIIVVYICLFKPLVGFYLLTTIAFFYFEVIIVLRRSVPLSTGIELLILFVFIGTMLQRKRDLTSDGNLFQTAISIALLFNLIIVILQAFNPNIDSIAGWVPGMKRTTASILIYVVAYRLIDTYAKFLFFIKFWVVMSLLAALYGWYQQIFGYTSFELAFINQTPGAIALLYQGGQLRKSSFLVDVPTFAILSGSMAVLTLLLGMNERNLKKRFVYFLCAFILELAMTFSGTRTANIMLPTGLSLYGMMTIQSRRTVVSLFVLLMILLFVLFAPIYSIPTLNRVRTTFDTKDESLNLRDRNRQYIQPYIYTHPLGGGLSTTGKEGLNYYPDHALADFPPDSGLLKSALETGWVGLIVLMLMYFAIFFQGIYYYFSMRVEEYRKYIVVFLSTLFSIVITMYSQMSIGAFPTIIFIFSSFSLMKRLKEFDVNYRKKYYID